MERRREGTGRRGSRHDRWIAIGLAVAVVAVLLLAARADGRGPELAGGHLPGDGDLASEPAMAAPWTAAPLPPGWQRSIGS